MGIDREVFRDIRASKNTSCLCDGTDRWICHYPNKRKSDKRTGSISRSRIYRKTEKFIFSNREWKACVLY